MTGKSTLDTTMHPARIRLADALSAHVPADDAERVHRSHILELVLGSAGCFDRGHYTPGHVTGSAFIVCRATTRVLLHHHQKLNRWLQMGGHDDGDMDPYKTALREAREESGLTDLAPLVEKILDLDVHEIPERTSEPAHQHHDVRYVLVTSRPEDIVLDPNESRAIGWFTLDEAAKQMGEPGSTRALMKIAKLLG